MASLFLVCRTWRSNKRNVDSIVGRIQHIHCHVAWLCNLRHLLAGGDTKVWNKKTISFPPEASCYEMIYKWVDSYKFTLLRERHRKPYLPFSTNLKEWGLLTPSLETLCISYENWLGNLIFAVFVILYNKQIHLLWWCYPWATIWFPNSFCYNIHWKFRCADLY